MTDEGRNVFGPEQVQWILDEIQSAYDKDMNVVILLSYSWKSPREFGMDRLHEKERIAELIMTLGFNTGNGKPWLVMISGDSHMLTYDDGSLNLFGNFPIFQCSPLDSTPACKWAGWSEYVETQRGQYCNFEIESNDEDQCLHFKGFRMDEQIMGHKVCRSDAVKKTIPPRFRSFEHGNVWDWHDKT